MNKQEINTTDIEWVLEAVADTPHKINPELMQQNIHVKDGFIYASNGQIMRILYTGHPLPPGSMPVTQFMVWLMTKQPTEIDAKSFDYMDVIKAAREKPYMAETIKHENGGVEVRFVGVRN